MSGAPAARRVRASVIPARGGAAEEVVLDVATEMPVNVVYGFRPYAVMMMTPDDLEDFAVGFSLTEGVIRAPAEIRAIAVEPVEGGARLLVDLVPDRLHALLASERKRNMAGRTGCGLCGVEDLADLPLARRRTGPAPRIAPEAIHRALAELSAGQPLHDATRAVHAAAWADPDGHVILVREDVGRHNALDKLVGALLRREARPDDGFLLITSRSSFEMVEKAAAFGAGTLVAISAPTALALDRARHHAMTLVAVARDDAHTVFVGSGAPEPSPA